MKKGDFYLIGGLLLVILLIFAASKFYPGRSAEVVQIKVNGQVVFEKNLAEITEPFFWGNRGTDLMIKISPDGAEVVEADCPDKVCVKTGKITKTGQSIICVPNRVEVLLSGNGNEEVDGVVY